MENTTDSIIRPPSKLIPCAIAFAPAYSLDSPFGLLNVNGLCSTGADSGLMRVLEFWALGNFSVSLNDFVFRRVLLCSFEFN